MQTSTRTSARAIPLGAGARTLVRRNVGLLTLLGFVGRSLKLERSGGLKSALLRELAPSCAGWPCFSLGKKERFRVELAVFALVLLTLNWSLLRGECHSTLIFLPSRVRDGEWWRVLTHPFIHVTWFHLLLDGSAFFLLYNELKEHSFVRRISCVLAGAIGSLVVPLLADPTISSKGLCGISGTAHGLMAFSALEMIASRDKLTSRLGIGCLALLVAKCVIEVITGKMLFTSWYFGLVGDPVAATHAGGVAGGLAVWLLGRCFGAFKPAATPAFV